MSKVSECPECGKKEIDVAHDGQTYCANCGYVFEVCQLVSSISWDDSGGRTTVSGGFVNTETGRTRGGGQSGKSSSRQATVEKAQQRIREVGSLLKLYQHHLDAALRMFKVALDYNFTNGRKKDHVVAACLYLACRRDKTPHMLIDFADALASNVFVLGHTYIQLCSRLGIQPPLIDPSLYIPRFASQLEFGNKEREVSNTALRIIQSMQRDWILTGRRPTGLCGAALMVAARAHGFNRSIEDIVSVVKLGDSTLRKRILEFIHTPSINLTPSQIMSMDIKGNTLPPCLVASLKKEQKIKLAENKNHKKRKKLDDGGGGGGGGAGEDEEMMKPKRKKARLESMNLLDNSLRNQVDYGPSAIELAIKQAGGEETWDEEEDNESQPNVDIEKEMNDVMSQAQSALVSTKNKPVPLDLDGITEEEDKENDSQTNIVDKNSIDKKSVGGGGGAGAGGGSGGSGGVAGGLTMKRSSSSPNISPVSSQKPRFFPKFNVDTIQTNFELQEESDIDSVVSEDEEQQKQLQNEENTTTQPESNTTTTETNPKPQQLPEEVVLATQEKESEVKDKTKKKKTTTTTKTKKKKELEKEKSKSKKGKKKSKKDADEEKENKKKSKNKKKGKDDDDDDDDDDEDDSETEETTRKKKKRDDKKSKSKKSKKKVDDDSEDDEDEEATTKKKRKSSKKKHTDEDDDDDDEDEEDTTTKKRKKKSTKKSGENEKNTTKNKRSSSSSKKSTKKDAKNKGPRVFDDNGDEVNEDDEEESPPKLYKQYREKTGEELDTFSDVDDDEIDHYIIKDENTIKAKYLLWHHYNKDYIQKQKEKEALRQQKGENSNPRRSRPKKVQPDSAAEAVLQALMPKVPKKSSLINWDAIGGDSLFKDLEQGKSLLDVDEEDESHQHHHNHGTDQYFSNQTATTSSSHIPSDDEEEDKVMEEEEEPNLDEDVVDNALMEIDMF
eukprot:TRINITY_DN637_c0_g1_i3.p1 TRINITY_DN637_c0_g1~~TRINITY_DN637_c0_g1_i3.p1  ORF type:complete len:951 (-),score=391.98 TRINITY_DN637_c0_g1_i3:178-3030(-)